MESERDKFEQNVGVIRDVVVLEWWRLVRYDGSILCRETGEVFGINRRLDEDYDSMLRVKDAVETLYVDEYGAGVLCPGGIENVSIRTWIEIRQSSSIAFWRFSLYRSDISVVVVDLWCDVARTREIVVSVLRIRLMYCPIPEEGGSTSHRYQYLSHKVMSYHH